MEVYGQQYVKKWFGSRKERKKAGGYSIPRTPNNRYHKRPARREGRLEAERQNEARYDGEDYDPDTWYYDYEYWDQREVRPMLRVPRWPTIGDLLASSP